MINNFSHLSINILASFILVHKYQSSLGSFFILFIQHTCHHDVQNKVEKNVGGQVSSSLSSISKKSKKGRRNNENGTYQNSLTEKDENSNPNTQDQHFSEPTELPSSSLASTTVFFSFCRRNDKQGSLHSIGRTHHHRHHRHHHHHHKQTNEQYHRSNSRLHQFNTYGTV